MGLNSQGQIYVYGVGDDDNSWSEIPGSLSRIAVGSYANAWGFNSEGTIYRLNSSTLGLCASGICPANSWDLVAADLNPAVISAGFDQAAWIVDRSGNVWRYDSHSQSFVQAGTGMSSIAVGADAAVWALDSAGHIYQYW